MQIREIVAAVLLRAACFVGVIGTICLTKKSSGIDKQTITNVLIVACLLTLLSLAAKIGVQ